MESRKSLFAACPHSSLSDIKRLPEEKVFKLGKQVQLLRQYLAMAEPGAANASSPSLASMEDYGFKSSSEVLDLISAVSRPDGLFL